MDVRDMYSHQDASAAVKMTRELIETPSATGYEGAIAEYVAEKFRSLGMRVEMQEVEEGRNNVVARWRSGTHGKRLMLLAHFDTSTVPGEDLPIGYQPVATVKDGWIYGLGVSNMKCAFSGFYSALQMLIDSGTHLNGEIIVAGVIGEILKAPIDEWRGRRFRGGGSGAHYMFSHGVLADFCINGEPTGLRLQPLNGGYAFFRIHIKGDPQEAYSKDQAIDPIPKAFRVHERLLHWESEYQAARRHPHITPQILIGSMYAGYPYKPHISAPFCNLYLHVQTVPGENVMSVQNEVETVVGELMAEDLSLDASVQMYLNEPGYEIPFDDPLPTAVARAHQAVFGSEVSIPDPRRCAISSDNNSLATHSVPAVTYGPGGINLSGGYGMYQPGLGEVLKIDNLLGYARVVATAATELLSSG